jgi:hypothetical protein
MKIRLKYCCARILINEINSNHESRTPEALARNVVLIRELNSNVAKVCTFSSAFSLSSVSFLPFRFEDKAFTGRGAVQGHHEFLRGAQ